MVALARRQALCSCSPCSPCPVSLQESPENPSESCPPTLRPLTPSHSEAVPPPKPPSGLKTRKLDIPAAANLTFYLLNNWLVQYHEHFCNVQKEQVGRWP